MISSVNFNNKSFFNTDKINDVIPNVSSHIVNSPPLGEGQGGGYLSPGCIP